MSPLSSRLGSLLARVQRRLAQGPPWLLSGLGLLLGCSSAPPTFEEVANGHIALDERDRGVLSELLDANGLARESVAVLREGDDPSAATFARLEGDRVVALRLASVRSTAPLERSDILDTLRELSLEGDFEAAALHGLPALESLSLVSPDGTLRRLELSELPALGSLSVHGGGLADTLHLDDLGALRSVGLTQCGLERVPDFPASTLTHLNLAGNRIRDLAPLGRFTELETLHLEANELASLATLPPLPRLRSLYLGHNPLAATVRLDPDDFPSLKTLDLRFTGLESVPDGLRGLPVQWHEEQARRIDFRETLESLRAAQREAHGEWVSALPTDRGRRTDTGGSCRWKTSSLSRAEVRCELTIGTLEGLAAVELGTTDPAFPFQGGGTPRVRAELRVGEGSAALLVRDSFDLVDLARQLSGVDRETAEAARQPEDHFDGYRRLEARPGSPAVLEGEPSLLGSRVVLWLASEKGARSLTLTVAPPGDFDGP